MGYCNSEVFSLGSEHLPGHDGEFARPSNKALCWCVVVRLASPRQCRQRRRGPRTKGGDAPLTCQAHAAREADAQVYRQRLYEAGKAEIARSVTCAKEYETQLEGLAKMLGV